MPLYIKDEEVAALAVRLQAATGARTKTDAVRAALEHELAGQSAARSFDDRNAEVLRMAEALGPVGLAFDLKPFADEMWGD